MKRNLGLTKTIPVMLLLLFAFIKLKGNDYFHAGARSAGMGYVSAATSDIWSVFNNQAGMALIDAAAIGINYDNRFLMDELGVRSIGIVFPVSFGVFGISGQYFGYHLYNQTSAGLAYAASFSHRVRAGIKLNYLKTKLSGTYKSFDHINFELGLSINITDDLIIAIHSYNPLGLNISELGDYEPQLVILKSGILYHITEKLDLNFEVLKHSEYTPEIRTGIEYEIIANTFVRLGYHNVTRNTQSTQAKDISEVTFGFGITFKNLKVDMSTSVNQILGWSPSVSICYQIKRKRHHETFRN